VVEQGRVEVLVEERLYLVWPIGEFRR